MYNSCFASADRSHLHSSLLALNTCRECRSSHRIRSSWVKTWGKLRCASLSLSSHTSSPANTQTTGPQWRINNKNNTFILVVQNKNVGTGAQFLVLQTLQMMCHSDAQAGRVNKRKVGVAVGDFALVRVLYIYLSIHLSIYIIQQNVCVCIYMPDSLFNTLFACGSL